MERCTSAREAPRLPTAAKPLRLPTLDFSPSLSCRETGRGVTFAGSFDAPSAISLSGLTLEERLSGDLLVGPPHSLVERSLGSLGPVARRLCCVLAEPSLETPLLHRYGFAALGTPDQLTGKPLPEDTEAILVVAHGLDISAVRRALEVLSNINNVPTVIVAVILAPEPRGLGSTFDAKACMDMGERFAGSREELFDIGADDVMCLIGGEAVTPHRIIESIHKTMYTATKLSDVIDAQSKAVEDRCAKKLQQAHRRFLMMLPGDVLPNIPVEDDHLEEHRDAEGNLVGVGDSVFHAKLGAGAFGRVFEARHPKYGTCAVKAVPKKVLTSATTLFSLDREVCQMLYISPHPNVVRAHEVLHGPTHIYVLMELAGPFHLQRFTRSFLDKSGEAALPAPVVESFCEQQAAALTHLHTARVCHRDLKPDNWIVSADGSTLRLVDFGLAITLVGTGQLLRQSCGSLPFCAPEVFAVENEELGYCGLAADVWSLGVNYMELVLGPYSIERLLGWLPEHPDSHEAIFAGLLSIEERWAQSAPSALRAATLSQVISNILVLEPAKRWKASQVLIAQNDTAIQPRPPRSPQRRLRAKESREDFPMGTFARAEGG